MMLTTYCTYTYHTTLILESIYNSSNVFSVCLNVVLSSVLCLYRE